MANKEVKEKLTYETPYVNLVASSVQDVLNTSDLYSNDMGWIPEEDLGL